MMNMQNQDMNLVLSTDAKPRLKWTPDLHQRFIEAIAQLGGADKATPKSLMRVMGIPGLTLYHLKSHLQKYRLGKSQQSENCNESYQEEYSSGSLSREIHIKAEINDGSVNQINESLQISQALQMQMEVQRKLHEQIEVQRHLQLRIEAQGKYLQSVLKKAQETLTGYNSTSAGVELAKSELSHLVSMVDTSILDSSLSELTETGGSKIKDLEKNFVTMGTRSSMESSLTSLESSGRKGDKERRFETAEAIHNHSPRATLQLMEGSQASGRKRSGSTISDANCIELQPVKRLPSLDDQLRKYELLDKIDLNSQYQPGVDSGPKPGIIDLNCRRVEQFSGNL